MDKKTSILLIVIVGFTLYLNSFFNGFVWDDEEQIVLNTQVHSIANIPSFFTGSTFNSGGAAKMGGLYYRPLMTTVFSLIYSIFGSGAFFFHFFQVTIHIASTILLFLILSRFLEKEKLSLVLSMLFLVHPVNSETVLYIAGLQDVLFFFFGILSLWIVISKGDLKHLLISALLLFFSIASKETGIVWWGIIGLYTFKFKNKSFKTLIAPLTFFAVFYSFLRFGVARIFLAKHGLTEISRINLTGRLLNVPAVASYYLSKLVWPVNLAIDQQWVVKDFSVSLFHLPLVVSLVFLSILISGAIYLIKKRDKHAVFYIISLIGFLLSFSMHLQIFPLDMTVSDRFFYMPMAFLLALVGVFLARIKKERIAVWILSSLVVLFSLRTFIRTFDWRSSFTLYSHDIKYSESFNLEHNLGVELYRRGEIEEAGKHFEKSIEMSPNWWTNYNNLGAYWETKGDLSKAEGLYLTAVVNGNYYLAVENYARIIYKEKKYEELETFLTKYLPIYPNNQILQVLWQAVDQSMGN